MSEPQLQRPSSLVELPLLDAKSRSSSLKSLPIRNNKVEFLSKPRNSITVSSLPQLRKGLLAERKTLPHGQSVGALHKQAPDTAETDHLRGFSREFLGLPKRHGANEDDEQEKHDDDVDAGKINAQRENVHAEEPTGEPLGEMEVPIRAEDWNDRVAIVDENGVDMRGHFSQPILRYAVKRTNNNFKFPWAATRPVAPELQVPGVLEIDADMIQAPPGTLEPIRKFRPASVNSMHIYTDEQKRMLERIESRFNFKPNPRFPHTKTFMRRRVSSDPHNRSMPDIFIPPGIDTRWLSKEAPARLHQPIVCPSKADISHDIGIMAIPSSVVFTDYAPNRTYEKEVIVKNITQNSRRFRLSAPPPYTHSPYFTVALISAPAEHGTNGLVAPGMSLRYKVTFTPNSLANFRQIFIVSTEIGKIFEVPFIAQREAPRLTLPDVLNCGPSRAGYDNVRVWDFKNEGGPGRFLIVPEHLKVDPYTVFDTMEEREKYAIASSPPFDVFPAFLTLKKGESGQIVVRYSPTKLLEGEASNALGGRRDEGIFKLVCDNCTISDFPIEGLAQDPGIQIAGIHAPDGSVIEGPDLSTVPGYDFYVPFGKQNPGSTTLYVVTIRNTSLLQLPFQWTVCNAPSDNDGKDLESLQKNPTFQIIPLRGWLPPNADMKFEVAFTPEETKYFNVFCNLNLLHSDRRNLGEAGDDKIVNNAYGCALSMRCTGQGVPFQVSISPDILMIPDVLHTGSIYSTVLRMSNESVSEVAFEWDADDISENTLDVAISHTWGKIEAWACCKIKLQCRGIFPGIVCGTLNCKIAHGPAIRVPITARVALAPGALRFDTNLVDFGLLALGSKKTVQVPLISNAPIPLHWKVNGFKRNREDGTRDCYITYEPSEGLILPGECQKLAITYVPVWYQSLRAILECSIVDNATPIKLNKSESDNEDEHELRSQQVRLKEHVAVAAVEMKAEVQTPRATIMDPVNALTCFLNVPCAYYIEMRNVSMLPAEFQWQNIICEQYSVSFFPRTGNIPGGKVISIKVQFVGHVHGHLADLLFACHIVGMVEHNGYLGIKLSVKVYGIDIELRLEEPLNIDTSLRAQRAGSPKPHQLSLDFGEECPIFAKRQGTLIIRNRTAIPAPFRIYMEKYEATALKGDDELQGASDSLDGGEAMEKAMVNAGTTPIANANSPSRSLLPPSNIEKLGFSSKTGMQYISQIKEVRRLIKRMHALLREGRGAAFHSSPSSKTIGPWETVRVNVTSYNNLVGLYEDNLICEVRGWERQVIPIRLGVIGLPVRFFGAHLVAKQKESTDTIDRVNFGTRITNLTWASVNGVRAYPYPRSDRTEEEALQLGEKEAHSKVIHIENQSPRDIRLTWVTYIKHTPLGSSPPSIAEILTPENRLEQDALGMFGVMPATMVLPAFKSTSIRIFFRSGMVGAFDGLLVADVGYIQKDGKPLYGHGRKESTRRPGTDEAFPVSHLTSMACVHVQGRAIEPRLSLDIGDRIRMKESFWGKQDDGPSLSGSEGRTVNVFLENNTDSVCSFTIHATPRELFTVTCADDPAEQSKDTGQKKVAHASAKGGRKQSGTARSRSMSLGKILMVSGSYLHELKPTEQMLISVRYTPHPHPAKSQADALPGPVTDSFPLPVKSPVAPPAPYSPRSAISSVSMGLLSAKQDDQLSSDEDAENTPKAPADNAGKFASVNVPPSFEAAGIPDSRVEGSAQRISPAASVASLKGSSLPIEAPFGKDLSVPATETLHADPGSASEESPLNSATPTGSPAVAPQVPAATVPGSEVNLTSAGPAAAHDVAKPLSKHGSNASLKGSNPSLRASVVLPKPSRASSSSDRTKRAVTKKPADTPSLEETPTLPSPPAVELKPDISLTTRPMTARSRIVAEGTLNIYFTNGIKQQIPLIVEDTT